MENEAYYSALKEFITASGMSVSDFADYARMHPEILKECFDTESKMIIGTFLSIALGCTKVMEETEDPAKRDELKQLYARYYDAYLTEWPNEFLSVANPHFYRKVEEMAAAAGDAVSAKVRRLYHPDEAEENKPAEEDIRAELDKLLTRLNEKGQREALRRIQEMAYIPDYQAGGNR